MFGILALKTELVIFIYLLYLTRTGPIEIKMFFYQWSPGKDRQLHKIKTSKQVQVYTCKQKVQTTYPKQFCRQIFQNGFKSIQQNQIMEF